jgi:gamma-glutamyltranspeptidase/glutathione hydrolase
MPPPTQGLASLIILGIFERLGCAEAEDFAFVHGMVEASKCAFRVRDAHVTDPAYMTVDPASFLTDEALSRCAESIDARRAMPSTPAPAPGDTVWLGAVDSAGRAVSCIQSLYWEFGSGVVLDGTGIVWQNRGSYLSLDEHNVNLITPRRKPFHTIHPAMARLADGRLLVYGTMGGEGQPQTQAALYARYVLYGQELQSAVTAPRWLYGRTWGAATSGLRIEDRFASGVIDALVEAGHEVETVAPFTEIMGHAGAIVRHPDGLLEGAVDPRGDGVVAAF